MARTTAISCFNGRPYQRSVSSGYQSTTQAKTSSRPSPRMLSQTLPPPVFVTSAVTTSDTKSSGTDTSSADQPWWRRVARWSSRSVSLSSQ